VLNTGGFKLQKLSLMSTTQLTIKLFICGVVAFAKLDKGKVHGLSIQSVFYENEQ
jgi:hypothetical protein